MKLLCVSCLMLVALGGGPASALGQSFSCPAPLSVPDRWNDQNGDGAWTPGELYDPVSTGYQLPEDQGAVLVLDPGAPGVSRILERYFGVNYPPLGESEPPKTGVNWISTWFTQCSPYSVAPGSVLQVEPGNVIDAVNNAVDELIALDPGASWNDATGSVSGSAFPESPRLVVLPAFDPREPPTSGDNSVHVVKFVKVFLEAREAPSRIRARLADVSSQPTPTGRRSWSSLKFRYMIETGSGRTEP